MAQDDPTIRKFLRAADQRFTAAEWLLRHGMNIEATYLAGYTVECVMKALLLRHTPARSRTRLSADEFRGRRGHSFERLKEMLKQRGCKLPASLADDFRRVASWSTDVRYETGLIPTQEAEQFLKSASRIRDWVRRS